MIGCVITGTVWTATAHVITAVIGAGVLSLAWSVAQLGWVAGPLVLLLFAAITVVSVNLLSDCYRSPHPRYGPARNRSYVHAVNFFLGENRIKSFSGYGHIWATNRGNNLSCVRIYVIIPLFTRIKL